MSSTVYLETSRAFVDKLLSVDNELEAKIMDGKDKKADEIYRLYFDRLSLYEMACLVPLSKNHKLFLQNKKEEIYVDLKWFKSKQELKKHLDLALSEINYLKRSYEYK